MKKYVIPLAAASIFALAGCGTAANTTTTAAAQSTLNVVIYPQGSWSENFNPFSPNALGGTVGFLYEPLEQFINLSGKSVNWLAKGYSWSNNNTVLTLHLRSGVKWTNGTPFTAKDVVFTLNLMKRFPGIDSNAVWSFLRSVSAPNASTVVFTLNKPNASAFYYLTSITPVPQSVWSKVKNPVTYTNTNPVVTGPYILGKFNPQDYTFQKNSHYWQPGKPKVSTLSFPAYTSNSSVDLALSKGFVDWAALFTPDIQKTYVATNPKSHKYWFGQGAPVMLFLNNAVYPLSSSSVRTALSYAIDRSQVSNQGEYGYEKPATALGIPPGQASYADPTALSQAPSSYHPNKAVRMLKALGFTINSGGQMLMPNGKPFQISLLVVSSYSDWVQDVTVIASELKKIGIDATVKPLQYSAYYSDLQNGSYSAAIGWSYSGPNPFYYFNFGMNSLYSAPIGKPASSNVERFHSSKANQYLASYNSTTNPAAQQQALNKLETLWVQQMPSIPLVWGAYWNEYNTGKFSGWPTPTNPYTDPGPNDAAQELTVLHLTPKK